MSRKWRNSLFKGFMGLGAAAGAAVLIYLICFLCIKGAGSLSLSFVFSPASNFGASGGIWFQLMGSLLMTLIAGLIAFPIALGSAIYIQVLISSPRRQSWFHQLLLVYNGVPSIVYGMFGLICFVYLFGTGRSWFVGSIILAIMILPTVTYSGIQSIRSIDKAYLENASALGLNQWQIIKRVYIHQSMGGVLTGLFLGLARAIGETAPIMFVATAFSGVGIPNSLGQPVSSLPTHILALAQQAGNPKALANAWSAALVLVLLVFLNNLLAFPFRLKTRRK